MSLFLTHPFCLMLAVCSALAATPVWSMPLRQDATAQPPQNFRVVIDPGHGGSDHGTIYDNGRVKIAEKDVTLAIAREVSRQLTLKGYPVALTRQKDLEVGLTDRTGMANRLGADVFLSIHMNSTQTPMVSDAEGVETYILNTATDASSKRIARLENGVLGGRTVNDAGGGLDVALILKDLRLDANLSESKRLACAVQDRLTTASLGLSKLPVRRARLKLTRHRDRGVKQALFHVLLGADMPSILVEAGFLTSPRDRAAVMSIHGRATLARAIVEAVDHFRTQKNTRLARLELSRCKVH